jgi:hypothetical protein
VSGIIHRVMPSTHFPLRVGRERMTVEQEAAELEAGARWTALFPIGTMPGTLCVPDRDYPLAPRGSDGVAGGNMSHKTGFMLVPGM